MPLPSLNQLLTDCFDVGDQSANCSRIHAEVGVLGFEKFSDNAWDALYRMDGGKQAIADGFYCVLEYCGEMDEEELAIDFLHAILILGMPNAALNSKEGENYWKILHHCIYWLHSNYDEMNVKTIDLATSCLQEINSRTKGFDFGQVLRPPKQNFQDWEDKYKFPFPETPFVSEAIFAVQVTLLHLWSKPSVSDFWIDLAASLPTHIREIENGGSIVNFSDHFDQPLPETFKAYILMITGYCYEVFNCDEYGEDPPGFMKLLKASVS